MALTIDEADAMIAAAEGAGKLLRVIDNYRFHPPFVRAKQILESGGIGEPMSVRIKTASGTAPNGWEIPQSSHQWRSDPTLSGEGSVLFDHGHHVWTIARYLLGDIERVFAYIGSTEVVSHHEIVPGGTLDNPGMIVWKYAGRDVYGTCESVHSEELIVRSTHYPIDVSIEITGSRGILYVHQGPNGQMVPRPPIEILRDGSMTSIDNLETDYTAGFRLAIEDFVQAIFGRSQVRPHRRGGAGGPALLASDGAIRPRRARKSSSQTSASCVARLRPLGLEPRLPVHHVGVVELLIRLCQVEDALDQTDRSDGKETDYPD